jgi:protein TonB
MAMNLIDRPALAHNGIGHRGFGSAAGSAALHAAVALTLVAGWRVGSQNAEPVAAQLLIPQHLVWLPHAGAGGGRSSGGDHSPAPPRQARQIGHDAITVPTAQAATTTSLTTSPPEDLPEIPATPMADATLALAGAIQGDSTSTSAGPGSTGTGTASGADRGDLGNQPADGFGPDVRRGGPGVIMPTVIEQVSPRYTADAMRARIQGSVWIECVVMADGTVGDLRVMRSLDRTFGLDDEAVKAARRWRFRPGRINGEPVPVVVTIELIFSVR